MPKTAIFTDTENTDTPKNTVLILGAGATRAAGICRSSGAIPPLDSDFFKIAETMVTSAIKADLKKMSRKAVNKVIKKMAKSTSIYSDKKIAIAIVKATAEAMKEEMAKSMPKAMVKSVVTDVTKKQLKKIAKAEPKKASKATPKYTPKYRMRGMATAIARAMMKKLHAEYEYCKVMDTLKKIYGTYSENMSGSLEMATSFLFLRMQESKDSNLQKSEESKIEKEFITLLRLMHKVFANTTDGISVGKNSLLYNFLKQVLKEDSNVSIITFNYDIVIERVIEELSSNTNVKWNFPSCYRLNRAYKFPSSSGMKPLSDWSRKTSKGISVLKLHGSMNWQTAHNSKNPSQGGLYSPNKPLYIVNAKKIHTNLTLKRKVPNKRAKTLHMVPMIIPPISGKIHIMNTAIKPIWIAAEDALKKADRVIIAGYSCPETDIEARRLLAENLRRDPDQDQDRRIELHIIDPNPDSAAKFPAICGVGSAKTYSSIQDWIDDPGNQ